MTVRKLYFDVPNLKTMKECRVYVELRHDIPRVIHNGDINNVVKSFDLKLTSNLKEFEKGQFRECGYIEMGSRVKHSFVPCQGPFKVTEATEPDGDWPC